MMNRGRASARQTRSTPAAANPDPTTSRAASATVAPPSRSATPAGRGAAATTTRATRAAAPVGRFRPKVIRRDEAERDTLARQEEQKANERAAEERRALRGRGRGRSRRSRGDAMGRGGMRGMSATASGPFSSGIAGLSTILIISTTPSKLTESSRRQVWWLVWRRRRRWWCRLWLQSSRALSRFESREGGLPSKRRPWES